jgi:hypothetical protein
MVEASLDHPDELPDAHLPTPQSVLGHDHSGEAGDEGAVHVEERANLRPSRAGLDLGD